MIDILRPGLLMSVQDLGRSGYRHTGVTTGGALNTFALSAANLLVGNPIGAAGLEIAMGACELRFTQRTRIALSGSDFDARLDGRPLPPYWSCPVDQGQTLRLSQSGPENQPGAYAYLAVDGGINVPLVLGSRSTDLMAGFGGLDGRALRKGDRLSVEPSCRHAMGPAFGVQSPQWVGLDTHQSSSEEPVTLHVLTGPEFAQFTVDARRNLFQKKWRITPESNRMGYRLAGVELKRKPGRDLLSHGVLPGVIQVPPSGQPIILMSDAHTTGGYPKIGVIIAADMWKLAQTPLNSVIRFELCDMEYALAALNRLQKYLDQIEQAVATLDWSRATHYGT